MNHWVPLVSRRVLALQGSEAFSFLQGLITQDVEQAKSAPIFGAFLNAKGRFLGDLYIIFWQEQLFVDIDTCHLPAFMHLLNLYGPLHQVTWKDHSKMLTVCAAFGPEVDGLFEDRSFTPHQKGLYYQDPRHPYLGKRALIPFSNWDHLPHPLLIVEKTETYFKHSFTHFIPEGSRDLIPEKSFLLEYGYHQLNAISWNKGCYVGQEWVARTFHRQQIQRELFGLSDLKGPIPVPGTALLYKGQKIGHMASHYGHQGMACFNQQVTEPLLGNPLDLEFLTDSCETHGFSGLLQSQFSRQHSEPLRHWV